MTIKRNRELVRDLDRVEMQINESKRVSRKKPKNLFLSIWCDDDEAAIDFGGYIVDSEPFRKAVAVYVAELRVEKKRIVRELRGRV